MLEEILLFYENAAPHFHISLFVWIFRWFVIPPTGLNTLSINKDKKLLIMTVKPLKRPKSFTDLLCNDFESFKKINFKLPGGKQPVYNNFVCMRQALKGQKTVFTNDKEDFPEEDLERNRDFRFEDL